MKQNSSSSYLCVKRLAQRYAVAVPTIWRWARDPNNAFPKPVKLGENCTRWRLEDVEQWEAGREAA